MQSKILAILAGAASLVAAEDVLGVYIFHRHGDRTAKAWKPVNMTSLGADEVHSSGDFYRRRYVESDADLRVTDISPKQAVLSQLQVTSPIDAVLHNSAVVFLQGLYPPTDAASESLANGTTVNAPLDGYQYIPVSALDEAASSKKSESNEWLQGGSGCSNAEASSNSYLKSAAYADTSADSRDFYLGLLPVINSTFDEDDATFKNAYTIFDYINVASIHNSSIPSDDLLTNDARDRLFSLASTHEWNLAYNSSEPVRAIAGSVLAGQVIDALEPIVNGETDKPRFNVQFGAYGTFMAFFGLAQLPAASPDFYGICDYASSMTFELVTNSTDAKPKPEDISVRFFFSNGTTGQNDLKPFPLFAQDQMTLKWDDFKSGMDKFAIADTQHWCDACGSKEGKCASSASDASSESTDGGSGNGVSKPVAGVIGALVTLVVIFTVQAAVMLLGGLRLVKKSTLARAQQGAETATKS